MADIPRAVLSEQFQALMSGRRLKAAVFFTFTFEPDFFEQEILPAVMPEIQRSHVPAIRLLQLEDALKSNVEDVAVYYDRAGLIPGAQSAKLDIRRIPTRHSTGCFHPKNLFLLTEAIDADNGGHREERLITACLSANLTRKGWWENVEACHIEDVAAHTRCGFREDLLRLFRSVRAASRAEEQHGALERIRRFAQELTPREHRSSKGVLHTRLYCGQSAVADFLKEYLGDLANGTYLEVISPYFNKADVQPLVSIIEGFTPRETRVYLPRGDEGEALCEQAVFEAAVKLPNLHWGTLPAELLRAGKQEQSKRRNVHAKVYRLFNPRTRYEALLIGSVNLTTSAHTGRGNLESAFLIETSLTYRPEWWLERDKSRPPLFQPEPDDEAPQITSPLQVRYSWDTGKAEAYWDSLTISDELTVAAQGVPLMRLTSLATRSWIELSPQDAGAIRNVLSNTSFLSVTDHLGQEALILVQEEGMAHKPSLLTSFSAADILKWWALLSVEQRAAALEDKLESIPEALAQLGIDHPPMPSPSSSMFASFAGIYHAFFSLERAIHGALEQGKVRDAEYRMLGQKYDSLPHLLDKIQKVSTEQDQVEAYVIALCARQLVEAIEQDFPEFVAERSGPYKLLKDQIESAQKLKDSLPFGSDDERLQFIGWFEQWFLRRVSLRSAVS